MDAESLSNGRRPRFFSGPFASWHHRALPKEFYAMDIDLAEIERFLPCILYEEKAIPTDLYMALKQDDVSHSALEDLWGRVNPWQLQTVDLTAQSMWHKPEALLIFSPPRATEFLVLRLEDMLGAFRPMWKKPRDTAHLYSIAGMWTSPEEMELVIREQRQDLANLITLFGPLGPLGGWHSQTTEITLKNGHRHRIQWNALVPGCTSCKKAVSRSPLAKRHGPCLCAERAFIEGRRAAPPPASMQCLGRAMCFYCGVYTCASISKGSLPLWHRLPQAVLRDALDCQ